MNALRTWLACAAAALLVGCGGGTMLASGGIVGTGDGALFLNGVLSATGSGSITVNGVAMDVRQAAVSIDGSAASADALRVGMVVSVEATAQTSGAVVAHRVEFRAEVRGVVDGVDSAARAFTVLGQRVDTDAATVFDGGTFDTLRNQWVEVSGLRAPGGVLRATRVEIRPGPETRSAQVSGSVSALDAVARTFRVGAALVDYASVAAPAGLRDGSEVLVTGALAPSGDRLVASAVVLIAAAAGSEGARVEVEGLVANFVSLARFEVSGRVVDASTATIEGGLPGAIVDGARVEVEGRLRNGVLVATRVEIKEVPTIAIEGAVEAVDAAALRLVVAGQPLAVTAGTQYADASSAPVAGFGLASIAVGDRLVVRAQRHATGLVATRVERRDRSAPPAGTPIRVEGVVSAFVSTANFVVGAQKVNAGSAHFENGPATELRDGRRVEAEGVLSGDVLLATRIAFVADTGTPPVAVEIEGAISGFVSVARFRLAGQVVDASAARFANGTAADLADGRLVTVRGVVTGGIVQASSVEFHGSSQPPATAIVELEGPITGFVSVADFTVEGQRVDATAARFTGGTAASLANGRRVHVKGPLSGGFVRATSVQVEDGAGVEAHVEGRITAFVSVANFTVAGRVVDASVARFENGTAADLRVGREVHVEGRLVGAVLRASRVAVQ
ncbi:MAG: DUF5666 domain-containing protein [Betaproteobacteria bacterium]|jgi:hypothetical protein|nr:DUF5666 domain-containing protein [Betaproteobacteria bacterium]